VHRQIADDLEGVLVDRADRPRAEGDLREALDVEEVAGAQMLVALGLVGVDRRAPDGAVGGGAVLAELEAALERAELAADGGDAEVLDREADARVGGVDGVARLPKLVGTSEGGEPAL